MYAYRSFTYTAYGVAFAEGSPFIHSFQPPFPPWPHGEFESVPAGGQFMCETQTGGPSSAVLKRFPPCLSWSFLHLYELILAVWLQALNAKF